MPPANFSADTTAETAAAEFASSITGQVILVTGTSLGGLGGETARVIGLHQPRLLILAGRSQAKLDETAALLRQQAPGIALRSLIVDLSSLESVRKAAAEVLTYTEKIDVLINNAAIMAAPYAVTVDNLEQQFATNHLGPSLFTVLIKQQLAPSPRIVNVSSIAQRRSPVVFEDVGFANGSTYEKWAAYGQSKTANCQFTVALAERWKDIDACSLSLHPGVILDTALTRHMPKEEVERLSKSLPEAAKSVPCGASTTIVAAFDPSLKTASGSYLFDCQLANEKAAEYSLSKDNSEKLWTLSGKLVGQDYTTHARL